MCWVVIQNHVLAISSELPQPSERASSSFSHWSQPEQISSFMVSHTPTSVRFWSWTIIPVLVVFDGDTSLCSTKYVFYPWRSFMWSRTRASCCRAASNPEEAGRSVIQNLMAHLSRLCSAGCCDDDPQTPMGMSSLSIGIWALRMASSRSLAFLFLLSPPLGAMSLHIHTHYMQRTFMRGCGWRQKGTEMSERL
jgi:hypothetical protein